MNRSILIVICDFLLLSLLTFSTDMTKMADEGAKSPTRVEIATNAVANTSNSDLAAAMRLALEEEQANRVQLQQQLAAVRENTNQQASQLMERAQENARLQQQFAAAQTNLASLNQQLQSTAQQLQTTAQQARQTQEQLLAAQGRAEQQAEIAARLQQQLSQASQTNQIDQSERQRLAGQLQLAEAEGRAAREQVTLMQQEVQAERAENVRLTENFKTLATNSTQLAQEIRENRPLAPNTIFSEFVSNHVAVDITASRSSFLGIDSNKGRRTETVLVSDGTNTFALSHVQDTPFALRDPGTDWDSLSGTLTGAADVPIRSLLFDVQDPRVVMVPVNPEDVRRLGRPPYHISSDPYKFQDAVLVGADESYYGVCNFQIEVDTPQYVRLDRSVLKGLFGKFNPSRGDLVFSRTGEFLGIMVNSTYCLTIHNFASSANFQFGPNVKLQHTGETLAQLSDYLLQLPWRLQ
jgi:hypothetical protein